MKLSEDPAAPSAFSLRNSVVYSIKTVSNALDPSPISLSSIKSFYNPRSAITPSDLPLPSTTLPFSTSKSLPIHHMHTLGIQELSIPDWIEFLVSTEMSGGEGAIETDITRSAQFAERVLQVLAKAWSTLPPASQARTFSLLTSVACIPSRNGIVSEPCSSSERPCLHPLSACRPQVTPGQAYFPNVSLFPDLAIVSFPSTSVIKGQMEKLLVALGVKRHVDLAHLFSSLKTIDGGKGWGTSELIRYLVSVRDTLTATEIDKLRLTPGAFRPSFPRPLSYVKTLMNRLITCSIFCRDGWHETCPVRFVRAYGKASANGAADPTVG